MAPLEPWEKVLVNEAFLSSTHGKASCISCHGGEQSSDKAIAHTGLVARPSNDAEGTCGSCHNEIVTTAATSLHSDLTGYKVAMYSRSTREIIPRWMRLMATTVHPATPPVAIVTSVSRFRLEVGS